MNSAVMQQKKITFPMITFHQYHGSGSNFGLKIHIHTALNYTGRLRIKYMVQQRTLCKVFEDDHYCSALYKYARELAIRYTNFTSFISTDDKNKIKCG